MCSSACLLSLFGLVLASRGTGTEGASVGAEYAANDLAAQCPPNTTADLTADADSLCNASGSVTVGDDGNMTDAMNIVERACEGAGSCRVVCRFNNPCEFGIQSV